MNNPDDTREASSKSKLLPWLSFTELPAFWLALFDVVSCFCCSVFFFLRVWGGEEDGELKVSESDCKRQDWAVITTVSRR